MRISKDTHTELRDAPLSSKCVVRDLMCVCARTLALSQFSPTEHMALGVMNREKHRVSVMIGAANVISLWWRKRRNSQKITFRQRKMAMYGYR